MASIPVEVFCPPAFDYDRLRIIDMRFTPPRITAHYLPIAVESSVEYGANKTQEYVAGLTLKRIDHDTYAFTGKSYEEKAERGKQRILAFSCRRSTGTIMQKVAP